LTIEQFDILEVSARTELNGVDDIVNVYQFRSEGVLTLTDEEGIDDVIEFLEVIYAIWNVIQSALNLYRDIRVRNVTQDIVYGVFPWPNLVAGLSNTNPLPGGNAMLINFSTGMPRVTPRKYFGAMTLDEIDATGSLTAATIVEGADIATLLLEEYIATNGLWRYGYFSPKTSAFQIPTAGVVEDVVAYPRRRKAGRG